MSNTTLIVLVIVGAVIVIAFAIWIAVSVRRRNRVAAMNPRERELYEAERQYDDAVAKAEKTLKITDDIWAKRVKAAEDALTDANAIGSRPIGSYRKVKAFEDHVETPSGAFRFESGPVEATVDTPASLLASKDSVLSRAGQEVMRELMAARDKPEKAQNPFLLIETPVFVDITEAKVDDASKLRQFALSLASSSRNLASVADMRARAVAEAEQTLATTRGEAERAGGAAREELEKAKNSTGRLEAAREAAAGETAAPSPESSGGAPSAAPEDRL